MWKQMLCAVILSYVSCGVWGAAAPADPYPTKPVKIIDGFAAGGNTDFMGRVIAAKMQVLRAR